MYNDSKYLFFTAIVCPLYTMHTLVYIHTHNMYSWRGLPTFSRNKLKTQFVGSDLRENERIEWTTRAPTYTPIPTAAAPVVANKTGMKVFNQPYKMHAIYMYICVRVCAIIIVRRKSDRACTIRFGPMFIYI